MPFEIEKKLIQLEYMCNAWCEIYDYDADALEIAQSQVEKAIISIAQDLVEVYRTEKETRCVEKLSD